MAAPVRPLERRYTLDEVISDPEVRALVRGVAIDTIHFRSGSSDIEDDQLDSLDVLADAILQTLEEDDSQIFLIAGHTDATGSDALNLALSEDRAASVMEELIEGYGVPSENCGSWAMESNT